VLTKVETETFFLFILSLLATSPIVKISIAEFGVGTYSIYDKFIDRILRGIILELMSHILKFFGRQMKLRNFFSPILQSDDSS